MRPIKQTSDFCTCVKGVTVPKNALYGNVNGVFYICADTSFTACGYKLRALAPTWEYWRVIFTRDFKAGAAIERYIKEFTASTEYRAEKAIYCEHRVKRQRAFAEYAERAATKYAQEKARKDRRFLRDAGAPRERRVPEPMYKTTAYQAKPADQRGFEAEVYCRDTKPLPMPMRTREEYVFSRFDGTPHMHRDGMKTSFKDYHLSADDKNNNVNADKTSYTLVYIDRNGKKDNVSGKMTARVTTRDKAGKVTMKEY